MPLHFDIKEYVNRRNRLLELMAGSELDGMLIFRQESMFYLTGYDTFGYVFFQCLFLGGDGKTDFADPAYRICGRHRTRPS